MYTVSALFDITVPFFVFAPPPPPNENTFRRPWEEACMHCISFYGNAYIQEADNSIVQKVIFMFYRILLIRVQLSSF